MKMQEQNVASELQLKIYLFPAVIFDIVQQVSFLIDSFDADNKWCKAARTEQFNTTCNKIKK